MQEHIEKNKEMLPMETTFELITPQRCREHMYSPLILLGRVIFIPEKKYPSLSLIKMVA
jgi:hypothetical protein